MSENPCLHGSKVDYRKLSASVILKSVVGEKPGPERKIASVICVDDEDPHALGHQDAVDLDAGIASALMLLAIAVNGQ
ncbi:MAG: hypothetical protein K9L32_12840 [Chromatiaceae bacterium]|nr:hypothetical protein [Chromatiaceae bacterium]